MRWFCRMQGIVPVHTAPCLHARVPRLTAHPCIRPDRPAPPPSAFGPQQHCHNSHAHSIHTPHAQAFLCPLPPAPWPKDLPGVARMMTSANRTVSSTVPAVAPGWAASSALIFSFVGSRLEYITGCFFSRCLPLRQKEGPTARHHQSGSTRPPYFPTWVEMETRNQAVSRRARPALD